MPAEAHHIPHLSSIRLPVMVLVTILLGACAAILLLPALSDLLSLVQLAAGLGHRERDTHAARAGDLPRLLVLVPAHNEAVLIQSCVGSLLAMRYPADRLRIVVIADNCTDATANIARAAGADCLERRDPTRRGKPWAIAWALEHFPLRDYNAVVIVDADSIVNAGFATALAASAPLDQRAVQPYIDVSNRADNQLTRMAAVFSAARFRFMNVLKQRAGLNVPLGNGLCLGTGVLAAYGWHTFSLCEDWELYASLTAHGVPIESVLSARIYSQEARSLRQSSSQRQRWTAGKFTVLGRYGWPLLRSPRIRPRQKLDALAELTAPGPVVLLGTAILLGIASWLLPIPGAAVVAMAFFASVVRPLAYTAAALGSDPEPGKAVLAFSFLPLYLVWRLGVQARAMAMVGNRPWIRTERHAQSG